MLGRDDGLSPGQLKATRRGCEAHDLKMPETWDASPGDSGYLCSYYLGERLFLELLEALGRAEFATRLGELYRAVEEVGDAASVIQDFWCKATIHTAALPCATPRGTDLNSTRRVAVWSPPITPAAPRLGAPWLTHPALLFARFHPW